MTDSETSDDSDTLVRSHSLLMRTFPNIQMLSPLQYLQATYVHGLPDEIVRCLSLLEAS